jgi:hypothetical protein
MGASDTVQFDLIDEERRRLGVATISVLPSLRKVGDSHVLMDLRGTPVDDGLEPIRLLEGCEYVYEIDGGGGDVTIDIPDLFVADSPNGRRGRLRTKQSTGRVAVRVAIEGIWSQAFAFEVRSSKLDYLDDYRWMLQAIADVGCGLVLERFAPSQQWLAIAPETDAQTLYQRFVFLRGILEGERLTAGLQRILADPYVQWAPLTEWVSPGLGIRGGGHVVRALLRPGPRRDWPTEHHPAIGSLPHKLCATRTEEAVDNVPNRFVRFALEEWRALVENMLGILEAERERSPGKVAAPVERGLREGISLAQSLDELLRSWLFEDVGRLTEFPAANQVLQRKEGYREVLHGYLLVQLGASLTWRGGEDVFGGGQRNVATLYEYWVFLELAKVVSSLCDDTLDLQTLVGESSEGLSLVLRREQAHVVRGHFHRRGRSFKVELCFNQQFSPGANGTWTKSLRPDCSLHIIPTDPAREDDDISLHFDAKYRVTRIQDLVGEDGDDPVLIAKTEDLYKMHTYRDAILRAAGAYVIFPGTEPLLRAQFQEILPGLGAFPLRPSREGSPDGASAIREFLDNTFDHVATHTTKHERARYWRRTAATGLSTASSLEAATFLRKPPADTLVLLGFVKNAEHHTWIERNALYNLRADPQRRGAVGLLSSELAADIVALYGDLGAGRTLFRVVDEPCIHLADELSALDYPRPGGRLYFCLRLEAVEPPRWWSPQSISVLAESLRRGQARGTPVAITWQELVGASGV